MGLLLTALGLALLSAADPAKDSLQGDLDREEDEEDDFYLMMMAMDEEDEFF